MTERTMLAVVFLLAGLCGCQLHPRPTEVTAEPLPPAPTPELPYHVSDMRLRTVGSADYLFTRSRVSFSELTQPLQTVAARLQTLGTLRGGALGQSLLLVYHDPTEDTDVPFDLEIGAVSRNWPTAVPEGFERRQLEEFHCAAVIYRGPIRLLPKAYEKLMPEMIAAGLVPSEQTREQYLVWDGPDSPHNVVQIEVGIRE